MLTALRSVCTVDRPVLPFCVFLRVGNSGVDETPWLLGIAEGRDGVFNREGV